MNRAEASRILEYYEQDARPFFDEHQKGSLPALDRCCELLRRALAREARLQVGLIGESQVGKSSLVNALLDTIALPAGGVGPLTAMETRVEYAEDRTIEVAYHGAENLRELAKKLHGHLLSRGTATPVPEIAAAPDEDDEPTPTEAGDVEDAQRLREKRRDAMDAMLAQGRKIICGRDDPWSDPLALEDRVVIRALFASANSDPVPSDLVAHADRILAIRKLLGSREVLRESQAPPYPGFPGLLATRAAGWMAPLVSDLVARLKGPVAKSMSLVDLPGIGVVGDPAGDVARKFLLGGKADAVVLVMKNTGLMSGVADLLRSTGVITRMLFGGTAEDTRTLRVVVVVTNLDNVASEEELRQADRAEQTGVPAESPDQIFVRLSAGMVQKVRDQLRTTLLESPDLQDTDDVEQRAQRTAVIERLCRDLEICCVSAPSYAHLQRKRTKFLTTLEATGIPRLRERLVQIAGEHAAEVEGAVAAAGEALLGLVVQLLDRLDASWQEGGAAIEEWDTFRAELKAAAEPLREQMIAFHAAFQSHLTEVVPRDIEAICVAASDKGTKCLARLRAQAQRLYWPSLDAALRNDGVWVRQQVNYPFELTDAMVETIATEWDPKVIQSIRGALKQLVERDIKLVDQLCAVARKHEKRISAEDHIEAQKAILLEESRSAVALTKERLEELKESVQQELFEQVKGPIARECSRIRKLGKNHGRGAKQVIIEALQSGGSAAVLDARACASKVLKRHYDRIVGQLAKDFLPQIHDPIAAALAALTDEQQARARRSDAQRRREVQQAIAGLRAGLTRSRKTTTAKTSSERTAP